MENPTQPKSEATPATHNNQPKGDATDLAVVSLDALILEIFRRERAGDCLALVVTPNDLAEYWECDDSGSTHPGSRVPEAGEMRAIKKAFHRWQDNGAHSEMMEWLRDVWQAEQARQLDAQEEKGDVR